MKQENDDFQKKLLATFRVEAAERINAMVDRLFELEKSENPVDQRELIEKLFRETHSLKGAARAVSSSEIERIASSFESVFASLKKREQSLSPELLNILHRATGRLQQFLATIVTATTSEKTRTADVIVGELETALSGAAQSSLPPIPALAVQPKTGMSGRGPSDGTVRIAVAKLDSLLIQVEEMLSTKLSAAQRSADLQKLQGEFGSWKRTWNSINAELHTVARSVGKDESHGERNRKAREHASLLRLADSSSSFLEAFERQLAQLAKSSLHDERSLAMKVENLLEDAKKAVMFPFSSLLEGFPKLVRDLAHDQKKHANLVMEGTDIEIDRRILEILKDPFIHLIRNCVDHGIESTEDRKRLGKSNHGTITISVVQRNGSKIEVIVSDDGLGINPAKVRAAAVRHSLLTEPEAAGLTNSDVMELIFQSGVSTSAMITDVSGRGLGLAIVRETVERLGGQVSVESTSGRGTIFRLLLPITLATFQGLLIRSGENLFVIPTASIERVMRVHNEDVRTVENRETVVVNGTVVSLARLVDVLGVRRRSKGSNGTESLHVVLLNAGGRRIAFVVDEVLHEQEVLVKNLGPQLARVRNIAGATVLGTGKVVPILHVADLMKFAVHGVELPRPAAEEQQAARLQSVLVVEDSITARTLLRSILESAGYTVTTAVDGIDALTQLRTGEFQLVVSDVDMPRMNGFDLTAKIRADKKLADVPVVLVTALESREDRERGVEVGANAYIVKSSFDQSNLLEVVKRLL